MNRIIMPTLTVLALGAVVLSGCSTSTTGSAPPSAPPTRGRPGTSLTSMDASRSGNSALVSWEAESSVVTNLSIQRCR